MTSHLELQTFVLELMEIALDRPGCLQLRIIVASNQVQWVYAGP